MTFGKLSLNNIKK